MMIDAVEFVNKEHARALAVMRLVYGLTDDEIVRRLEAPSESGEKLEDDDESQLRVVPFVDAPIEDPQVDW